MWISDAVLLLMVLGEVFLIAGENIHWMSGGQVLYNW
jgi:hypothetical protein